MSVLEVDIGTGPENADTSLQQKAGLPARPEAHRSDRKLPDTTADFPALQALVRLKNAKSLFNLVFFVYLWRNF